MEGGSKTSLPTLYEQVTIPFRIHPKDPSFPQVDSIKIKNGQIGSRHNVVPSPLTAGGPRGTRPFPPLGRPHSSVQVTYFDRVTGVFERTGLVGVEGVLEGKFI